MNIKYRLIHWLSQRLLPVVEEKDILSFNKQGHIFVDGHELSDTDKNNLRAEVKFLEESYVWKLLNVYFTNLASRKLFEESKDVTDILFVKSMLYTLSVQKKLISTIKVLK